MRVVTSQPGSIEQRLKRSPAIILLIPKKAAPKEA